MADSDSPDDGLLRCFPPLHDRDSRILILGSMPGAESLRRQQYYAHPRNAFWPVIEALFGIDHALPYGERARRLVRQGVALWDVMRACRRRGSLDSAIERESIETNDLAAFFQTHPALDAVFFNGGTAERTFRREIVARWPDADWLPTTRIRLTSTSPANARPNLADKIAQWQVLLSYL